MIFLILIYVYKLKLKGIVSELLNCMYYIGNKNNNQ